MADSKLVQMESATTLKEADVLYIVQSTQDKQLSASTLFRNLSNVVLKGNVAFDANIQVLDSPGIIDLTKTITKLEVGANAGNVVLPQTSSYQLKILAMTENSGGSYQVNANILGDQTLTFNSVGDSALLLSLNNTWAILSATATIS